MSIEIVVGVAEKLVSIYGTLSGLRNRSGRDNDDSVILSELARIVTDLADIRHSQAEILKALKDILPGVERIVEQGFLKLVTSEVETLHGLFLHDRNKLSESNTRDMRAIVRANMLSYIDKCAGLVAQLSGYGLPSAVAAGQVLGLAIAKCDLAFRLGSNRRDQQDSDAYGIAFLLTFLPTTEFWLNAKDERSIAWQISQTHLRIGAIEGTVAATSFKQQLRDGVKQKREPQHGRIRKEWKERYSRELRITGSLSTKFQGRVFETFSERFDEHEYEYNDAPPDRGGRRGSDGPGIREGLLNLLSSSDAVVYLNDRSLSPRTVEALGAQFALPAIHGFVPLSDQWIEVVPEAGDLHAIEVLEDLRARHLRERDVLNQQLSVRDALMKIRDEASAHLIRLRQRRNAR